MATRTPQATKTRKTPMKKRGTALATRARAKAAKKAPAPARESRVAKSKNAENVLKAIPAGKAPTEAKKRPRVRDTFAIPEADYARIGSLKLLAKRAGYKVKKNELIRLGLRALQQLDDTELQARVLALRDADRAAADA